MDTLRIKVGHQSPMVGAHWCHPIGWTPSNTISDSKFVNGAWRNSEGEIAGIVYFSPHDEGEEVDVPVEDLRVAACGEWEILEEITVADCTSQPPTRR